MIIDQNGSREMSKIAGGCLCGGVRYSSEVGPSLTAVCHCKHCQRQTGSSFSILVAMPKGSLEIKGESLAAFDDVGESGLPVIRHFCRDCGSPIFSDVSAMSDVDFLKAGTLDDASWLQPQVHIWCSHMQPWVSIEADTQRFEKNPPAG